ncbi:MAG: endo-1,4-beta-xylanase, partial [Phycisphaerae bacterium]|nr:endo-1,4-beta-xylanase [Phycisphaerae bacterium]
AAWKKAADARIDKHRKSDLNITIVDKSGSPVSGVPVRVELKRHYFRFGAVLPLDFTDGPHSATYKKYFLKYFNSAGFAMGLKTSVCPEGDCTQGRNTRFYRAAEKDFKWLAKHNIEVRGHNLAWEGANYLHATQKAILNDAKLSGKEKGSRIFALMSAHFHHSIKKWDAFCWDVINEPRGNHVVNDLLADKNSFVEWFKLAGRLRTEYKRSGMKLYYNENRVVSWSKWGSYEANRDNYMGHIQDILNAGAPIDGIGFQYRFKMHVSPEIVYKRLCDFDKFKLPYQATEFELFKGKKQTVDFPTARKKQMTAELMTVFFSHPLADGLWHWTFADKAPGRGMKTMPRALFTYNGRPGPEAEQWIRMMEVDFNTDETTKTALDGSVKVRGFKGIYKVTIGLGAKARTAIVTLEEDQKLRLTY